MGDRNNPIKFGPEWLRNMPRERSAARSTSNSQNTPSSPGTATSTGSPGATGGATASNSGSPATTNTTGTSKVLLAKLRYGREEMLALYDRNAEAPPELKLIDTLYQPRGMQPVALNNTFEDDMRDGLRGAPPASGMSPGDRFGLGRGRGVISDGRGRPRGTYIRSPVTGRGAHYMPKVGGPRMPYSGGADDDSGPTRAWSNNTLNNNGRNSGEQTEWATKTFRNKRQGTNTNWRQPQTREDGEEWRSSEPGRSRQLEKWERDWGDRPSGEKSQSWSTNRRTWVGGDTQNEENLPEWAGENAECGGTFDSSGAFHGYSNDDTNLPKQDSSYPLTRSHTHGSFPRPKALEEGSDEWWASEKAKKLSPKRFDASDIKFKKQSSIVMADGGNTTSTNNKSNTSKEETVQDAHEKRETTASSEPPEVNAAQSDEKYNNQNLFKSKFGESKTFDALMRSDINVEEASDERGNFQSVIITPNNSLRQKHQHMVLAADGQKHIRITLKGNNKSESDHGAHKSPEDMLVDNIFGMTIDDEEMISTSLSKSGHSSEITSGASGMPPNQNQNIQMSMSNSALPSLSGMTMEMHLNKQKNMQSTGMQSGHPMSNMQPNVMSSPGMQKVSGMQMQSGGHIQNPGMQSNAMQTPGLSNPIMASVGMQNPGLPPGGMQNSGLQSSGMQAPRVQTPGMQPVGITNSALNASLGLPIVPSGNIGLPHQGVPQQVMPNVCMANNMASSGMGVMGSPSMQAPGNMAGYQSSSGLPGNNVGNSSLFLGQNSNNPSMSSANEVSMSNHVGQNNMFPLHGLQHSGSQASFGNSIYSNNQNLADQWYYEDPERNIQGPFTSKDMYNWYRAGFFSPSLMVRRACETMMRPLGSYGPVVPFVQLDIMPGFPMSSGYESRPQGNHENMLNSQQSLGLDVMNIGNMNMSDNTPMESLQFGSVGLIANQSFGQPQQMVDSLWGQPSTSSDLMWMQQSLPRSEARVNNLPIYFWDQQPSAIASNSLLPEEIAKEMKTEDQILAQLRASQNMNQNQNLQYMGDPQPPTPTTLSTSKTEDCYPPLQTATPNLEELHKLIQKDNLTGSTSASELENDTQVKTEKISKLDQSSSDSSDTKQSQNSPVESKTAKQAKETDKSSKNKENNNTKNKSKKPKEEKKDDVEIRTKEEEVIKAEKRSQEPSPSKNKKDEKTNKKELEREKKEWIKEGYTIVKGSEKNASKDNKKKAEETRAAEEAERKRKEEEKLAVEEDKKKKQAESARKQQEQQQQQTQQPQQPQRQASEPVVKKAPWSVVATQAMQATNRDGLTLAEIQRLEREKKLEQMKEQQQMMQIIAQQQAAALAREQEMQAGLGWAKKKANNVNSPGQSLAEIQAEARKQAAAAVAAAAAQAFEEAQAAAAAAPPTTNHVPWGNALNGGGFWDTQADQPQKQTKPETPTKVDQNKTKKKPTIVIPAKKETSPAVEFENWCTGILASWSSKIDVPTFVGFLKDIESPYEVKDYVKCYLGESKDSSDFSRQFLERRSKLLRVGMVTPSDDLCSPAIAVNPRTISGSDYQEVKGKGKKTKKNKMLKVDARILGFSVTAAEDRINVGDIDTV